MDTKSNWKKTVGGYIWLAILIAYFSGIFSKSEGILSIFNFQTLIGSFGTIGDASRAGIIGEGGFGASDAVFQSVNMLPAIMVVLAILELADNYGGLIAAQKLLAPVLKILMGVSGKSTSVIITNWQSSDASAVTAAELYNDNQITSRERDILATYCFVAAATIGVYYSNGSILFPYITVDAGVGLAVIMIMKIIAANFMRLYNFIFEKNQPAFVTKSSSEQIQSATQEPQQNKSNGFINIFLNGCQRGLKMWALNILPGTVLGFVIMQVLQVSGILNILSIIFTPLMKPLQLPGEAISAWITAFLSLPGGCAALITLNAQGLLTTRQITIMLPMLFCVAGQIPYIGRILTVFKVKEKKYPVVFCISIIVSILSGIIMNMII
ncbi:nucleoside recognition domain-containing protein [Paratissierella segnis]|uniref:Nucleoside transporter/FeoB GTPase Gate domain-containing protein n=1 Tax=Paratissierella segnis TaxID=2763679 RepID=A0A926IKP2_9FIRM|nr:nucleoside recognition domain-containing protein [Paratissierella segnis]MBC8589274.1 hypothetical protein [Paratissierella segnis]